MRVKIFMSVDCTVYFHINLYKSLLGKLFFLFKILAKLDQSDFIAVQIELSLASQMGCAIVTDKEGTAMVTRKT